MLTLGDTVKDVISGIKGRIVARTEWLHRSPEVAVARPGCDADGRPWDLLWLDEGRLGKAEEDE